MNEYKTKVHKMLGKWRVDYYLPYSGCLYIDHDTWDDAMDEVDQIETARVFA